MATNVDIGGITRGECLKCRKKGYDCSGYQSKDGGKCIACEHSVASHINLSKPKLPIFSQDITME
jgi:hypothetical protein